MRQKNIKDTKNDTVHNSEQSKNKKLGSRNSQYRFDVSKLNVIITRHHKSPGNSMHHNCRKNGHAILNLV